nr:DUF2017 domain-containing protein [Microlunatus panaciterrae]
MLSTQLTSYEVDLLRSLVGQLVDMVSEGMPEPLEVEESDDPFARWAQDLQSDPDQPEMPEDPVLQRLFPNAYPHDPEASSDFRRYTERDLRAKKIAESQVVLRALEETENGARELQIRHEEVEEWLRTLTNLRLAVATRLGITDAESADELAELPEDDPRAFMMSVYDWLGFAQETMINAL